MRFGVRHVLLVNPSAGGGKAKRLLPETMAAFRTHELECRAVETRSAEHGCDEARRASKAGETPVVLSGDGLIGQVGGALAGSDASLGILPGGRGNDLARVLGIPREIAGAVQVLAARATRRIDVGEVNGRRFLGVASCGFDSDANRIANDARWVKGQLVYAYAAIRALLAWKPATFTLTLDGETHEFTGYSVAAANSGAFGGGMLVAPDARLDDGELDVVWISKVGKLRYASNLPKVFDGSHVQNDEVHVRRVAEVGIEADRPFAVYADGDHIADLPATVRVLPAALSVIAPPATA